MKRSTLLIFIQFLILLALTHCPNQIGGETFKPEISMKQETTEIACGTGEYNFGTVIEGSSTTMEFVIENNGAAELSLNGSPIIELSGNVLEFSVTQPLASTVTPGDSVTFDVAFSPTSTGDNTATVSIKTPFFEEAELHSAIRNTVGVVCPCPIIKSRRAVPGVSRVSGQNSYCPFCISPGVYKPPAVVSLCNLKIPVPGDVDISCKSDRFGQGLSSPFFKNCDVG